MITALRGMLKSNAYKVFLWIFLAVMIFGGVSFDFADNKPWIIKIYKEKSTELDFRQSVANSQKQYDYLKAQGITWPRTESIEKEVLRNTVNNLLMKHVSDQLGLIVPSMLLQEQLGSQLASLPAYFFDAQGQLNVGMLEKLIAPRTFDSLLEEMENEIKSNLLFHLISIGSHVCQFEVATQYTQDYADKQYSVLSFSLHKALEKVKEEKVSDETLERFYKKSEHGDLYKSVEKRSGHYWKFHAKDYGLTVSKADVTAYYDQHKQADYQEHPAQVQVHRIFFENSQNNSPSAKELAQTLRQELVENPTTFSAVAKKIGAAKLSLQGSEKTEFFAKDSNQYDKILVDTAFEQLAQDGDISDVIKTEKGYEVLQRVARKSAKYKSLSEVQSHIEEKLLEEKFAKRFKQDAERLISNARYNKGSIDAFVEKRKGRKESIALEAKKPGIISVQLFQTDSGSYAVFMDGKDGILLECTDVQKRGLIAFDSIKSQVMADYYKKQAVQELQSMTKQALQDAATMNFEQLAKKHDAHLEKVQSVYKNGQMDVSALLRKQQIAEKIKSLQSAGAMIDIVAGEEGYVICLDSVAQTDEKLFAEKKSSIESMLENKAKYKSRESFVDSLYRHAKLNNKIEIKETLLKDTEDTLL